MSATITSDEIPVPAMEQQSQSQLLIQPTDTISAKCECCGLTEEYTPSYIANVREHFLGKWVCGLCSEAVSYETGRDSGCLISKEQALANHISVCSQFQTSPPPPPDPMALISALGRVLRRSLVSPRAVRSAPVSPMKDAGRVSVLGRSESCVPALPGA